jgi:hypothetical protein
VSEALARQLLAEARTIAVLGAHPDLSRPAGYVPAYLWDQGYRIRPVNPRFVGQTLFGAPVVARLDEIDEPIDIVDVFRRAIDLPAHRDELFGMRPLPRALWLQQGIRHAGLCAEAAAAGLLTIEDRCTLADHRRFGMGR